MERLKFKFNAVRKQMSDNIYTVTTKAYDVILYDFYGNLIQSKIGISSCRRPSLLHCSKGNFYLLKEYI